MHRQSNSLFERGLSLLFGFLVSILPDADIIPELSPLSSLERDFFTPLGVFAPVLFEENANFVRINGHPHVGAAWLSKL